MRIALFSPRSNGHADPRPERVTRPSHPDHPGLEPQQALLLEVLRRAGGGPVSYAELTDAGVQLPAIVVSELELAGVAIERCSGRGPGSRRLIGVRLAPDPDPGPVGAERASRPTPGRLQVMFHERGRELRDCGRRFRVRYYERGGEFLRDCSQRFRVTYYERGQEVVIVALGLAVAAVLGALIASLR